ncbi:UNKNOWN [Stylonychia lemnae]|uniref:Uncharacterized protein n=1 Tax=Stylonychia lemnae TaxID=5949 RepID=A0A077ZTA6_STYLE|nr:UNKNOWN [Stylonychia lemnae]|eukprot:CDW73118.1 UNKNOWN [Stylonychia lemnae]
MQVKSKLNANNRHKQMKFELRDFKESAYLNNTDQYIKRNQVFHTCKIISVDDESEFLALSIEDGSSDTFTTQNQSHKPPNTKGKKFRELKSNYQISLRLNQKHKDQMQNNQNQVSQKNYNKTSQSLIKQKRAEKQTAKSQNKQLKLGGLTDSNSSPIIIQRQSVEVIRISSTQQIQGDEEDKFLQNAKDRDTFDADQDQFRLTENESLISMEVTNQQNK